MDIIEGRIFCDEDQVVLIASYCMQGNVIKPFIVLISQKCS